MGEFWRAVLGGSWGTEPWKGTCKQQVLEQGGCWIWGWDLLGRWLKDWGKSWKKSCHLGAFVQELGTGRLQRAARSASTQLAQGDAHGEDPSACWWSPKPPLCPTPLVGGEQVLTVQAGLADGLVDPAGLHHPLAQVAGFAALPARRVHLGEALVLGAPGGSLGEKTELGGDSWHRDSPCKGGQRNAWHPGRVVPWALPAPTGVLESWGPRSAPCSR